MGGREKPEKARKRSLPWSPRGGAALPTPSFQTRGPHVGLLAYRIIRQKFHIGLSSKSVVFVRAAIGN